MIGGLVPDNDEHWALFCDLLEIIRIIFAPTVSHNLVAYLQVLIQGHHERVQGIISRMSNNPPNALHDPYAKSNFKVHNVFL